MDTDTAQLDRAKKMQNSLDAALETGARQSEEAQKGAEEAVSEASQSAAERKKEKYDAAAEMMTASEEKSKTVMETLQKSRDEANITQEEVPMKCGGSVKPEDCCCSIFNFPRKRRVHTWTV